MKREINLSRDPDIFVKKYSEKFGITLTQANSALINLAWFFIEMWDEGKKVLIKECECGCYLKIDPPFKKLPKGLENL